MKFIFLKSHLSLMSGRKCRCFLGLVKVAWLIIETLPQDFLFFINILEECLNHLQAPVTSYEPTIQCRQQWSCSSDCCSVSSRILKASNIMVTLSSLLGMMG